MYLHIFVADVALSSDRGLTKQCVGLKLQVVNEDDLTEHSIFTANEATDLLFRFQQTICISLTDLPVAQSIDQRVPNYFIRLRFSLYAVYADSSKAQREQTVCLGYGRMTTSLHDATISKTVVLQEYHPAEERLQIVESKREFQSSGKLYLTLFFHSAPINLEETQVLPNQDTFKHSSAEYAFLMSRKIRNKNDGLVSFDPLLEGRLNKDIDWYRDNALQPAPKQRKSADQAKALKAKKSKAITAFAADTMTFNRQTKPESKFSANGKVVKSQSVPVVEAPKLRKTHMGVGFVKSEWPEAQQFDSERRIYQLRLATERKQQLLMEIKHESELLKKKQILKNGCSHMEQIHEQKARRDSLRQAKEEQATRLRLQQQQSDIKKLELQLAKTKLESALNLSKPSAVAVAQTNKTVKPTTKTVVRKSAEKKAIASPNRQRAATAATASTQPVQMFSRLLKDVKQQEQLSAKKSAKKQKMQSEVFDSVAHWDRMVLQSDAQQSSPFRNSAQSAHATTRVKARNSSQPVASSSPEALPSFVKSSIVASLRDSQFRDSSAGKPDNGKKSHVAKTSDTKRSTRVANSVIASEGSRNDVIRVSVQKIPRPAVPSAKARPDKITSYLDSDNSDASDYLADDIYFSRVPKTGTSAFHDKLYGVYPENDKFEHTNLLRSSGASRTVPVAPAIGHIPQTQPKAELPAQEQVYSDAKSDSEPESVAHSANSEGDRVHEDDLDADSIVVGNAHAAKSKDEDSEVGFMRDWQEDWRRQQDRGFQTDSDDDRWSNSDFSDLEKVESRSRHAFSSTTIPSNATDPSVAIKSDRATPLPRPEVESKRGLDQLSESQSMEVPGFLQSIVLPVERNQHSDATRLLTAGSNDDDEESSYSLPSPAFRPHTDFSFVDSDEELLQKVLQKKSIPVEEAPLRANQDSSDSEEFDKIFLEQQQRKLLYHQQQLERPSQLPDRAVGQALVSSESEDELRVYTQPRDRASAAAGQSQREEEETARRLYQHIMKEESDEDTVRALRTPINALRSDSVFGAIEEKRGTPLSMTSQLATESLAESRRLVTSQTTTLDKEKEKRINDRVRNRLLKNQQFSSVNNQKAEATAVVPPSTTDSTGHTLVLQSKPMQTDLTDSDKANFTISPGKFPLSRDETVNFQASRKSHSTVAKRFEKNRKFASASESVDSVEHLAKSLSTDRLTPEPLALASETVPHYPDPKSMQTDASADAKIVMSPGFKSKIRSEWSQIDSALGDLEMRVNATTLSKPQAQPSAILSLEEAAIQKLDSTIREKTDELEKRKDFFDQERKDFLQFLKEDSGQENELNEDEEHDHLRDALFEKLQLLDSDGDDSL